MTLLAVSLLLSACAPTENAKAPFPEAELLVPGTGSSQTMKVAEGDFIISAAGGLTVVYPHKAELTWEQSGARFAEVRVKKGQQVKEGDVLMTFDTQVSQAELAELRLQRQRKWDAYLAGKETRLAAIEAAKQKALGLTGYDLQIAELEIEKLQAQCDAYAFQSTRSVYAIDDQIRELESKDQNNVLTAPFDGVIDSVVSFSAGDPVTPRAVLITMHATDVFLLQAKDPNGLLRYGMPVTVESRSKTDTTFYTAHVVTAPNLLPASASDNTVLVAFDEAVTEAELENNLSYRADSQVLLGVLTIPKSAIEREGEKAFVYVLEDGTVQRKYITAYTGSGINAWVCEGLSAGQMLVID